MKPLLIGISIFSGFVALAQNEVSENAAATSVATAYFERLKTGKVSEAVNEFWDTDYFFTGSLGLTYLDLPAVEKKATRESFANFSAAPFANPNLGKLFSTIEIRRRETKRVTDTQIAVTLELSGDAGRFNATNTMLLAKNGSAWRIVDSRQNSSPSMRAAVVMMWVEERRGSNDSVAVVLERAAANIRRQTGSQ